MWFRNKQEKIQGKRPFSEIQAVVEESIPIKEFDPYLEYMKIGSKPIGQGATADVWKVESMQTGKHFVIKEYHEDAANQ